MKIYSFLLAFTLIYYSACSNENYHSGEITASFSTNGQTVYHLKTGSIKNGGRGIFTAAIDGSVKCFNPHGELLWEAETDGGFPFDLCVADINNNGTDEVLVASGNGNLYVFDSNGELIWTFSRVPPLYQVCVAKQSDGSSIILTGGVEQILYALSAEGEILNTLKTRHCIRHIRTGNIQNDGNESVAVATTSSGLRGVLSLMLIDPGDLTIVWEKTNLGQRLFNSGRRFFSMLVKDIDKNGYDEILLTGSWGENGIIYAYNRFGEMLFSKSDDQIPNIPYRMNLLRHVEMPHDEFIIGLFGNVLIVYEMDGSCREVLYGPYSFADCHFDPVLNTLFMGSAISGGDGVYSLRLDQPGWQQKYQSMLPVGKMAQINKNLETLKQQIKDFEAPSYQPSARKVDVISRKPQHIDFKHVIFTTNITLSQKIEDPNELWCRHHVDRRRPHDLTADELVSIVAQYEANKENFIIWSGHGKAVYYPLSTFERVIKAAPEYLLGFVFAEMEAIDEGMEEVVEGILLPLAELCKEHNKVIVFRNKNIFWNGSCYLPFWHKILLNERYREVFIPGMEETNSKTQELSLSGRIGLWQTGSFNRWACRIVTDNANFNRTFEWGGQQVITHHLRNLVSNAFLGSDVFFINLPSGSNRGGLNEQLIPFYQMLEKGIIQIPEKDQLLTLSGLAIGMKSPPSPTYIKHGINGYHFWFPEIQHSEMVFDHLDTYWGGASLAPYDFSNYAMNVQRRMCNFIPEYPYGLPAIIPAETDNNKQFNKIILTDGQFFYDEEGKNHTATEYKSVVKAALADEAAKMPVIVKGDVHWSAVRLDNQHIRIILIDPGYLDPDDRQAEIVLQHLSGISCIDILSKDKIAISDERITVDIPVGFFRILDLKHK